MKGKVVRRIVKIDEEKCDGCGLCIPQCKEGALQIIEGKARLVSERYCDGLGACLGHCPRGAISIEEREVDEFDEQALHEHLDSRQGAKGPGDGVERVHSCPSAKVMSFQGRKKESSGVENSWNGRGESALSQWPVQLALVPVSAPYLRHADLLIAADCVPFAYANFHRGLLEGKTVLVACPKLDDTRPYLQKLAHIFARCEIRSVTVAHMEVPCCFGLVNLVEEAVRLGGKEIPIKDVVVSVEGEIAEEVSTEKGDSSTGILRGSQDPMLAEKVWGKG
jgi:NAD-dependent dihydropyrimidine dehydrogenase PreA subunit